MLFNPRSIIYLQRKRKKRFAAKIIPVRIASSRRPWATLACAQAAATPLAAAADLNRHRCRSQPTRLRGRTSPRSLPPLRRSSASRRPWSTLACAQAAATPLAAAADLNHHCCRSQPTRLRGRTSARLLPPFRRSSTASGSNQRDSYSDWG